MSHYKNATYWTFHFAKEAAESHPCEVRIMDDGEIVVSYETDNNFVVYKGEEQGEGHYLLESEEPQGRASLHRFPDSLILEGYWEEDGLKGKQTVTSKDDPTLIGLKIIREYLRLDAKLRTRKPQADHVKKLSASDRMILDEHLAGKNVRNSDHIREKGSTLARSKYFSAVKNRIYGLLAIDISIRWDDQCKKLWPDLANFLVAENRYRIPSELSEYSYCRKTVRAAIKKLERSVGPLSVKMSSV